MGKKLTYEFVKKAFEVEGYTLLSRDYTNNSTKLSYKCTNNHVHSVSWNNWQAGSRCPQCSKKIKKTIEEVRASFLKEGYILLDKEYKNNKIKLNYTCPNGHKQSIRWTDWIRGYRCSICNKNYIPSIEEIKQSIAKEGYMLNSSDYTSLNDKLWLTCPQGHQFNISWGGWKKGNRCPCHDVVKKRVAFTKIKTVFEVEGYTLINKVYKNYHSKLDYICPKGHTHSISYAAWCAGARCPYCAGKNSPTIGYVRAEFEKEDYTLLSKEYINNKTKLDYICPNKHRHSIVWYSWLQGKRCPYCSGKAKPTMGKIKASFEKEGYTLLSTEYISSQKHLSYLCSYGHKHTMSWGHWTQGKRCPTCWYISNSGDKHYNWQGGKSFEPYCEAWKDKEYKQDIHSRDGNRCLNPYCSSNNPSDLTIHHIDYDKKNCHPSNLITVCRSCNSKANTNRTWHKYWYQAIIYRRSLV